MEKSAAPASKPSSTGRLPYWQWIIICTLLALAADWLIQRPDQQTRDLNATIATKGSEQLKTYPYPFRALRVTDGIAVLTTPRNRETPAFRFIGAIHPEIDVKNPNDPAFIAAEKELAAVQSEVSRIAAGQPGIKGVRWELDQAWLIKHGIAVN